MAENWTLNTPTACSIFFVWVEIFLVTIRSLSCEKLGDTQSRHLIFAIIPLDVEPLLSLNGETSSFTFHVGFLHTGNVLKMAKAIVVPKISRIRLSQRMIMG